MKQCPIHMSTNLSSPTTESLVDFPPGAIDKYWCKILHMLIFFLWWIYKTRKKSETFTLLEIEETGKQRSRRLMDMPHSVQLDRDPGKSTRQWSRFQSRNNHKCVIFIHGELSKKLPLFIHLMSLSDILYGIEFWSPDYIPQTLSTLPGTRQHIRY